MRHKKWRLPRRKKTRDMTDEAFERSAFRLDPYHAQKAEAEAFQRENPDLCGACRRDKHSLCSVKRCRCPQCYPDLFGKAKKDFFETNGENFKLSAMGSGEIVCYGKVCPHRTI